MTPQSKQMSRWLSTLCRLLAWLLDSRVAWTLCSLAAALLIYGSLEPRLAPPGAFALDKLIHLVAYGGLALLGCLPCDRVQHSLPVAAMLILLGGAIELTQSLVPGRDASLGDFAANTCGVLIGVALSRYLRPPLAAWSKLRLAS